AALGALVRHPMSDIRCSMCRLLGGLCCDFGGGCTAGGRGCVSVPRLRLLGYIGYRISVIGYRPSVLGHRTVRLAAASPATAAPTPRSALVALVVEGVARALQRAAPGPSLGPLAVTARRVTAALIRRLTVAAAILAGRRLERRHRAGTVLHAPLERARAPLVEVEAARHRLEPHLQALHLERVARHLDDQV